MALKFAITRHGNWEWEIDLVAQVIELCSRVGNKEFSEIMEQRLLSHALFQVNLIVYFFQIYFQSLTIFSIFFGSIQILLG